MADFEYFRAEESDQFSFFRIPKALFTEKEFASLSTDAKLLYGILLDRISLSKKNGWIDNDGYVYIIYTIAELQELLRMSHTTVTKLLYELDSVHGIGLIERYRQGNNRPSVIYVKNFVKRSRGIQLPGRENRISEPMYASVDEIMPDLLEAVGEIVKEKFILFGHSMGAKIAYELEKRLEQSGIYARHLIVSGSRPPHIPEPNPICNLPKREFIRELTRFAGTPKEILGNEEMMNFFIPLLRADFEMDEKYLRKNKVKLECSINAFCGENDTEATETDMQEWGEYTSDFALEVFAGDHFFIKSNAKTVQSLNEIIKRNI